MNKNIDYFMLKLGIKYAILIKIQYVNDNLNEFNNWVNN